jgi:hypothetical protein
MGLMPEPGGGYTVLQNSAVIGDSCQHNGHEHGSACSSMGTHMQCETSVQLPAAVLDNLQCERTGDLAYSCFALLFPR